MKILYFPLFLYSNQMQRGFTQQTKKIIKGTSANNAKYWRYLDTLQDSQNIHHFCMKMFQALISTSKDQFLDDDHEAMYSTLLILEFYKNTKLKSEKWLEETIKTFEENKPKLFENAKWIVNLYTKNYEESQFAFNFLSSIALIPQKFTWLVEPGQQIEESLKQAKDYYDIIELKRKDKPYKKLSNIAFPDTIRESKINAYSYCCFLDYIRSINYQPKKKLWLHIMDNLKGLIHCLRFTAKGYEILTIYLHCISSIITNYGCAYEDVLKDMIYFVNILRNSPGINSELASELFFLIHGELKCPGTAFRKELKRRFVNIDIKKSQNLGSEKYLLTYKKVLFGTPEYCSINNLRKLMIYNMLGCCKIQAINKLWNLIEPLDVDTTYNLYYKFMKIIEIASNLETYESIQKLIKENVNELFKVGWAPYKKIRKEEESELQNLVIEENTQKFFQFPNFQIISIKMESFLNEQYEYSIYQLIEQRRFQPYNQFFYSNFLQFVFLGNSEQFSRVLNKICGYLITLPTSELQKLAFYLIPARDGQNYLGEYLAHKDIWYRRHIFNVFREKTIFPYVSLEDPEIKDTFPSYLLTKSLHMYLREAKRKVPIQIFQCVMQMVGNPQPKTFYFASHILIGASLQCQLTKNDQKKQKKMPDLMEIYLEKVKKVYPIAVDAVIRYKEPGTNLLVTRQEKFLNIEDIQICNSPRPYFFGSKPSPLNLFIETSILTATAAKVFKSQLQSRQNFKRHSNGQITEAFRDLFINLTSESIIISRSEGMKDPLRMLIDGVEITDVQKFKVTPVYTNNSTNVNGIISKIPLALPFKCFLPFQA